MGDARGVVARIPPPEDRIGDDRSPQRILRIEIGAPDPLVDNGLKAFIARERAGLSPFDEDGDNARVLTDRSFALGRHAAVGQDLGDSVAGSRRLLQRIGLGQGVDIVERVINTDVLQRIRDAVG